MNEVQKTATTIDANLINESTLLRIIKESMYNCGLLDKLFDEREELASADQSWDEFMSYYQNAKESFNLKKIFTTRRVA